MTSRRRYAETLTPGIELAFEAREVLVDTFEAGHEVALIENDAFGRVLLIDGAVQLTSRDEFIYHEMMAHVPLLTHPSPRNVLIIGGGDCGLAEEVLKHARVERVVQVEIDAGIVDAARKHLAEINAPVFVDPRFELVIDDGARFVSDDRSRFDIVLVDSTDPVGPGAVLFSREFYRHVRARLSPGGILVTQNGVPMMQMREFTASMSRLAATFRDVAGYAITVPSYFGGEMVLGWSSDDPTVRDISLAALKERYLAAKLETRCYTPRYHQAAFILPRFVDEALDSAVTAARAV